MTCQVAPPHAAGLLFFVRAFCMLLPTRMYNPTRPTRKAQTMQFNSRRRRPRPATKQAAPTSRPLQASDLLSPAHPLNRSFTAWVRKRGGEGLTKRMARKFLTAYPNYRAVMVDLRPAVKEAA